MTGKRVTAVKNGKHTIKKSRNNNNEIEKMGEGDTLQRKKRHPI